MSLGLFSYVPPEVLAHICDFLDFEDVLSLQQSHIALEVTIGNAYFSKFHTANVNWMESATVLSLEGPSVSQHTITSNLHFWEDVIRQTRWISRLNLTKTEAAYKKEVINSIIREWRVCDINIVLKKSSKELTPNATLNGYKRLTRLVSSQKQWLKRVRLETSPTSFIEMHRQGSEAALVYQHQPNLQIHYQLIYPLFREMLGGEPPVSTLHLHVDGSEQLELSLQNAFNTALPFSQRESLQVLRIHFGPKASALPHEEVSRVLTTYAPTLHLTPKLTYIVCDLSNSLAEPSSLEEIFMAMSRELRGSHRISLVTAHTKEHLSALSRGGASMGGVFTKPSPVAEPHSSSSSAIRPLSIQVR